MYPSPHMLELLIRERYTSLLHERRHQHLVAAICQKSHRSGHWQQSLDQLGCLLISWGWRLRARYGQIECH